MNQFILLEGPDGAGKTTIGKRLAETIGAEYVKTPGDGYKGARAYIDQQASKEARLLFYLSSVVDASNTIARILPRKPVVCDRYVWSSLIPHAAYYEKDLDELEASFMPITKGIMQPTHTFLLQVEEQEQIRRIKGRAQDSPTASDQACLNERARKRLHFLYDEVAKREGWNAIDTTNRTVDSIVDEITKFCSVPVLV